MHLIKFLGQEYTGLEFPYANKYAWRMNSGIFCDIKMPADDLNKIAGVYYILDSNGYITFGNTLIANKTQALKWLKQNYDSIIECPDSYIDLPQSEKINTIESLQKYNDTCNTDIKWTSTDILNPAITIGNIFSSFLSAEKLSDEITWLTNNGYNDIYTTLLAADSYKPTDTTNSCGCFNSMSTIETGTCSAAAIYKAYMNNRTISIFTNIDFIHDIFLYKINNEDIVNDALIDTLKDFLETWKTSNNITISTSSHCPCNVQTNTDNIILIDNIIKTFDWIGTENECAHKTFITFWFGKLAEYLVSTF